jgi:hypothetical protein
MRNNALNHRFARIPAAAIILVILAFSIDGGSGIVSATPAAPGELTATASHTGQIILRWTDNSSDEIGFQIERATDSLFSNFKVSFTVPANQSTFSDSTVATSTTYYYRVFATGADGNSTVSNVASTTSTASQAFPLSPDRLSCKTLHADQVSLKWKDRSLNEDGFRIERAEDKLFIMNLKGFSVPTDTISFTDNGTSPLKTYYYRVIAYNSSGDSAPSDIISIKTPDSIPDPPDTLYGISPEYRQVKLQWIDNSVNETGFLVERATDAGFSQEVVRFTASANNNTGTNIVSVIDRHSPAGSYYFKVKALNTSGNSTPSNTIQVTVNDKYLDGLIPLRNNTVELSYPGFGLLGTRVSVDSQGKLINSLGDPMGQALTLNMSDYSGNIVIPQSTRMLNPNSKPLTVIAYNEPDLCPEPPDNKAVTAAFDFGPYGATFDRPVTLNLKYDTEDLLERTSPKDLKLVLWDGKSWQYPGDAQLNSDQNQFTYKTDRLVEAAIVSNKPDMSPKFLVSDLYIYPAYSQEGDTIRISARVTNKGFSFGYYELALEINNVIEDTQEVGVEAGNSTDIKFTCTAKPAGNYRVDINGVRGSFSVSASPNTGNPSPKVTTNIPTENTDLPVNPLSPPDNNLLIFAMIGVSALLIILMISYLLLKK